MIDLRFWRVSLLAVPLAVTVAMFSLQGEPPARQPALAPDAYDGEAASNLAAELARSYPDPRPGSEADQQLAALVQARFESIAGAGQAEQRFEVDGKKLRNLILILPGRSERQLALIAGRDTAAGSGAATSIASTAALLEIASSFSGSTHRKTLVFVSTDGDSIGAAGARRFVSDYGDVSKLDAAIVLSQPAAPDPSPPLVVPWSTGPQSTGIELSRTAGSVVAEETGTKAGDEGPLQDLYRLALPAGLGDQAPMVESGLDAVRISSSGERPLPPSEDVPSQVSRRSIERFGRAALALVLAFDAAPSPPSHGPDAYISLAGNLLPGWAIALVSLSLLIPVGVVAAQGLGSSARSPLEAARSLGWVARAALPFLASLLSVYALDLIGVVPDPAFPYDPALQSLGLGGRIGVLVALLVLAAGLYLLRPWRAPPARASATAAPAALALAAAGGLAVWLANPYLALPLGLGLNAWVLAARPGRPNRRSALLLVALGLLPVLLLVGDLAGRLGTGAGVVWDLLYMVADGQISFVLALLACLLAGCGLATVAAAGPVPAAPAPEIRVRSRIRRSSGPLLRAPRWRRRRAGAEEPAAERVPPAGAQEAGDEDSGEKPSRPVDPSVFW